MNTTLEKSHLKSFLRFEPGPLGMKSNRYHLCHVPPPRLNNLDNWVGSNLYNAYGINRGWMKIWYSHMWAYNMKSLVSLASSLQLESSFISYEVSLKSFSSSFPTWPQDCENFGQIVFKPRWLIFAKTFFLRHFFVGGSRKGFWPFKGENFFLSDLKKKL